MGEGGHDATLGNCLITRHQLPFAMYRYYFLILRLLWCFDNPTLRVSDRFHPKLDNNIDNLKY